MSGRIRKIPITKVYVIAHFALIEAGLLIPSYDKVERINKNGEKVTFKRPVIECKEKAWRGRTYISDFRWADSEIWGATKWLSEKKTKPPERKKLARNTGAPADTNLPVKHARKIKLSSRSNKKVWAHFGDSLHLRYASLGVHGDLINIPKLDAADQITEMDKLWQNEPRTFLEYAARDAIVTAQTFLFYHQLLSPFVGGQIAMRLPKYAELHFKIVLQLIYYKYLYGEPAPISTRTGLPLRIPKKDWVTAMGFRAKWVSTGNEDLTIPGYIAQNLPEELEEPPTTLEDYATYLIDFYKERNKNVPIATMPVHKVQEYVEIKYIEEVTRKRQTLVPTPGVSSFLPFYYGGRSECKIVGTTDKSVYWDLKSAYPTALLMLLDVDFSRCFTTTGDACEARLKILLEGGPFQVAGAYISWIFKPDVEPCFPMKVEGRRYKGEKTYTLIFPTSGVRSHPLARSVRCN